MPLEAWTPSKETLHRFLQIVGKIRLATAPGRNHWWHIAYHPTGRGLTTRPMGSDPIFTIDFDFVLHRLVISTSDGRMVSFPLVGNSVASFYKQTLTLLGVLGIGIIIKRPEPFGLADSTPFADDVEHRDYDPFWINRTGASQRGQPHARGVRWPLLGQNKPCIGTTMPAQPPTRDHLSWSSSKAPNELGATRAGWDIARLASPNGSTSRQSSQVGDSRVR